jgi:hypothetical protein
MSSSMYDVANIGGGTGWQHCRGIARARRVARDYPRNGKRLDARYERSVNRAMDVYLRFVNAWYTKEFIEVFLAPRNVVGLQPAVNAVLGGNVGNSFSIRWRMWVFYFPVWLQRHHQIAPRLTLVPRKEEAPTPMETVRAAP